MSSKKEVLLNSVTLHEIDFILLQEHHINGNQKIKLEGYVVFHKNRPVPGSKGGVCIAISDRFADHSVLVHESAQCELIAVRICNVKPNLVLITYYGAQENTTPSLKIREDITEVMNIVNKFSDQGCQVCVAGDFNILIGTRVLQANTNEQVSRGGKLFNDLMESNEDLHLLNEMHEGAPETHVDASGGRGNVLDLVVGNSAAKNNITELMIDNERLITPYRYLPKTKGKLYSDHLAICWEMELDVQETKEKIVEVWNYSKPLGTGKFGYYLEQGVHRLVRKLNDKTNSMQELMVMTNQERENALHRGYGKRKVEPKRWELLENERIAAYKREEIGKAVEKIRQERKNHNVPLKVFAARKSLLMAQRGDQFAAVKDPETGRKVETREGVYQAVIRYNEMNLGQNPGMDESWQQFRQFKLEYVNWAMDQEDGNEDTICWEDMLQTLRNLHERNKSCYSEIAKWGPKFRIFVYWLMREIFEKEELPEEFNKTSLQALYKRKGGKDDLGNYRFLHLKTCFSKLFESLVMRKCKGIMWEGFTDPQVGGLPNSRTTEHLYVIMTGMLRLEKCKKSPDGWIIIWKDVQKAFDRISVIDTLYATARSGVHGKVLRLLYQMNKETRFTVVGDPEEREFTKELIGGQGTSYACVASSLAMPQGMDRELRMWDSEREGTNDTLGVKLGTGKVRIEECEFVDDQASIAADAESARVKGRMITRSMNEINVLCHRTKTRFMIMGSEAYRREQEESLRENPIIIQGFEVQKSEEEKYLGMIIHQDGARKTMEKQMESRATQCEGKLAEIRQLLENPTMREFGYLAGCRVLFDSVVTSTFKYSAGTWLTMNKGHYEKCDKIQKKLLFSLLRIHDKVTLYHVLFELDLIPWSFEVMREKISLVTFLCHEKNSQAGRLCVLEAEESWGPGLVQEVTRWCEKNQLPDPTKVRLSKEIIGEKVKEAAKAEIFQSVIASKFVRPEVKHTNNFPDYLYREGLSDHQKRLLLFHRLGILFFKARYARRFGGDATCVYMDCHERDTFEHSLVCPKNPVRRPRDENNENQVLCYLERLHVERMESCGLALYG